VEAYSHSMQERRRHVIAIADASFCGMGRHHSMAGVIEQQPCQQMSDLLRRMVRWDQRASDFCRTDSNSARSIIGGCWPGRISFLYLTSPILALEIKTAQWPSKDPAGNPSAHSRDQSRQPIVGRTTDSWRASRARHRCRTNHRCKVYGEGKGDRRPRVEDIPSQSRRRHRVDRPIRSPDNLIPTALRAAATASRSPPNPVAGSDCAPNG
jgi:hypothetical protein